MAPSIPEEIDVFTRPHSRMKELVNNFTKKMLQADLSHAATLAGLVSQLHATLLEFRRHEAIENVLILDRLKQRIRQRRKRAPPHLGTCHDDDALPRLFEFVRWCEGVLGARGNCGGVEDSSCADVGDRLHSAYTHFLTHFLPHMKQEEQEFQPLLMTHFEYNELKALKTEVWQQHELYAEQQLQPREDRLILPAPQYWPVSSSSLKPGSGEATTTGTAARKKQRSPDTSTDGRTPADGRSGLPPAASFPRCSLRASPPAEIVPPPLSIPSSFTRTKKEQSGSSQNSRAIKESSLQTAAAQTGEESFVEALMLTETECTNKSKTSPIPGDVPELLPQRPYGNIGKIMTFKSSADSIHDTDTASSSMALSDAVVPPKRRRRPHQSFSNTNRVDFSSNVDQFDEEFVASLLTSMPPDDDALKVVSSNSAHQSSNNSYYSDEVELREYLSATCRTFPLLHKTRKPNVANMNSDDSAIELYSAHAGSRHGDQPKEATPLPPEEEAVTDKVFLTKSSKEFYNRQHLAYNNDLDCVASVLSQASIDDKWYSNEPSPVKVTNQNTASENFIPDKEKIPAFQRSHSPTGYSSNELSTSSSSSTDSLYFGWHHAHSTSNTSELDTQSLNSFGGASHVGVKQDTTAFLTGVKLDTTASLVGVKLDTTACVAGGTGLAVTRPSASLLVLSHEVLLQIMRFLSPKDLLRLACVSQALHVVTFDKSLWRHLMPTQWARGLWTWRDLRLGDALEDERCLDLENRLSSSLDEDADEDTASSSPSSTRGARRHRAVLRGLASVVCRRAGAAVHTIVLDGAGTAVCSRALNALLARCPNLVTLSAAYCSLDYFTFKGLWQRNALQQLRTLDLRGCEKLDDAALNCLAMCANRPFERQHAVTLRRPSDALRASYMTSERSSRSSSEDINSSASSSEDSSFCTPSKGLDNGASSENSGNEDEQEGLMRERRYDNYKKWLGIGRGSADVSPFHDGATTENLKKPNVNDEDYYSNAQYCGVGGSDDDGYGSVQRDSTMSDLVRWNYHPTQFDTVRVSSYLSTVIQTNLSVTKPSTLEQSRSPRSSSNQSSRRSTPVSQSEDPTNIERHSSLRYLNLSGCKSICDVGLDILSESGFLDSLQEADLSGCDRLTSHSLNKLVMNCPQLPWTSVAYCDNVQGTNGDLEASGCGNLVNPLRHCCRSGE